MQLNSLRPARGSHIKRRRGGRGMGSGLGRTCGRGDKGQRSRSGGRIRRGFEGGQMPLQRRLPKFGFTSGKQLITVEVGLSELNKLEAEVIDLKALKDAGVIAKRMKRAKVMASGQIERPITLRGIRVTKGARAAIEAAGGKIEE